MIVEKDIDVVRCPMGNLQHQRGAATESPGINDLEVTIDLIDQVTGNGEELFPLCCHQAAASPAQCMPDHVPNKAAAALSVSNEMP